MSDPLSIISAAVGAISSAYTICKASSDLVSGVKDAPKHISQVSENLQAFYPVLRALKSAFDGIQADSDGLIEDTCAAVHRSVQNCICIFRDLTLIVNKYRSIEPANGKTTIRYEDGYGKAVVGKWSAIKWDFRRSDIDALNVNLAQCKETCQLAVSTAHFIINQSNNKQVYESLQKNNNLLKKLLKKVVQNDRSVRRQSIRDGQSPSIAAYDITLDGKSERMSQFLADVESILSSTPTSTPRMSVVPQEAFQDEDLWNLRASFYELDSHSSSSATSGPLDYPPSLDFADNREPRGFSGEFQALSIVSLSAPGPRPNVGVEESQTMMCPKISAESSAQTDPGVRQSNNLPTDWAGSQTQITNPPDLDALMCTASASGTPRLVLKAFEEQVNAVLIDVDEAPQEIKSLRNFARRRPKIAQNVIGGYHQWEFVSEHTGDGWTSVFLAIALGKLNTAMQLRKQGSMIDQRQKSQATMPSALQLAALCNDHAAVLWLINEGANVDDKGSSARTPLQNAMLADNIKMMEFLLNQGAKLSARDQLGLLTWELAEKYEKTAILRYLLLNAIPTAGGMQRQTLLHYAASRDEIESVRWLLKNGSDANANDCEGQTPLHVALDFRKSGPDVVDLLLANGADPSCKDYQKKTPRQHASDLGRWDVFRLLRDAEADMNAINRGQLTPTQLLFPDDVR